MAACQPTNLLQVYKIHCGSGLARDGGLTGAPIFADIPDSSDTL
jgi:hypothetical protein